MIRIGEVTGDEMSAPSSAWPFHGITPGIYNLIEVDPPWQFKTRSQKGRGRCADKHYNVMRIEDILALPVGDLAAKDCCCFMWTTFPLLNRAMDCMEQWGFDYRSGGVWAKQTSRGKWAFGTGYRVRSTAEPFLLGFKGNPKNSRRHRNMIVGIRREHSRKPDEAKAWLDTYLLDKDARKIELFSRTNRDGWDCWGNEVGKFDRGYE